MSLFTKDEKLKVVPRTEESIFGGQFNIDLLKEGPPTIPTQEIAGLTPIQKLIQDQLAGTLKSTGESTALAKGEMTKTLTDQYDPRTSDLYRGLREESERLKTEGLTDVRQRAELGGMLQSTPAVAAEQSLINIADSNLLQQLGLLTEKERDRKVDAARDIQGVDAAGISNVAAIGGVADQQRAVEQARNDALYNAAIQQVLFPYTNMSNIASSLLNVQDQAFMTGGGMTDLGFGLATGASALGAYAGAGGFSGTSGTPTNVSAATQSRY